MIWAALACAMIVPFGVAVVNPLLAYRAPVYIASGFAGIAALALLLAQPLLAAGYLPGLHPARARRVHKWIGIGIIAAVVLHIGGLYLTSPPDTMDALLLVSPTPFSVYGVIGLWSLVLTGVLVAVRLRMRPALWRVTHNVLAAVVVGASVVHALMIEGTMGAGSKIVLCALVVLAGAVAIIHLRVVKPMRRNKAKAG